VAHAAWIEHFLSQYKIFRLAFSLLLQICLGHAAWRSNENQKYSRPLRIFVQQLGVMCPKNKLSKIQICIRSNPAALAIADIIIL
jgi:hypothetical protein